MSVLIAHYCSVDQIMKNEIGGTCSTYGGEGRCIQGFGGEILRWIFTKCDVRSWTGSRWLRIGKCGGLL